MSKIKQCFISRWGENGCLMQADFSQLEVIGVAFLSQDMNMYEDIMNGVDSHSQSASWLNPQYTYEEIYEGYKAEDPFFVALRKASKAPRFELQYGAGYRSIAENNKLTEEQAKGFVDRYYARYWKLKEWQEQNLKMVRSSRVSTDKRTKMGFPAGQGQLITETGRRFTFTEYDAPEWMKKKGNHTSFSPTEIKNYPSQGFATGDIVPMVLGELHYALKASVNKDNALLINTIHDSVMLDVHDVLYPCSSYILPEVAQLVKDTLERAPQYLQEIFDIPFDLPLKCDIEVGPNWGEMKRYDI